MATGEEPIAGGAEAIPDRLFPAARDRADGLPFGLQRLDRFGGLNPVGRVGQRLGLLAERESSSARLSARSWACAAKCASQRAQTSSCAVLKRRHNASACARGTSAASRHCCCSSRTLRAIASGSSTACSASILAHSCSWIATLAKRFQSSASRSSCSFRQERGLHGLQPPRHLVEVLLGRQRRHRPTSAVRTSRSARSAALSVRSRARRRAARRGRADAAARRQRFAAGPRIRLARLVCRARSLRVEFADIGPADPVRRRCRSTGRAIRGDDGEALARRGEIRVRQRLCRGVATSSPRRACRRSDSAPAASRASASACACARACSATRASLALALRRRVRRASSVGLERCGQRIAVRRRRGVDFGLDQRGRGGDHGRGGLGGGFGGFAGGPFLRLAHDGARALHGALVLPSRDDLIQLLRDR